MREKNEIRCVLFLFSCSNAAHNIKTVNDILNPNPELRNCSPKKLTSILFFANIGVFSHSSNKKYLSILKRESDNMNENIIFLFRSLPTSYNE